MMIYENQPSRMELFGCQVIFFFGNFSLKNGCKNQFDDINQKFVADPEMGFPKNRF